MIVDIVVESSPGRAHVYVRLTRPIAPAQGAALNRRLAAALGGDASGWDLTQLLRIPGTRSRKYDDKPLVHVSMMNGLQYDPDELDGLLPPLSSLLRQESRTATAGATRRISGGPPMKLSPTARRVWNGEDVKLTEGGSIDRSASLVRIARIGLGAGLTHDQLVAALAERDETLGWCKYTGRADALKQYEALAALVARGPRTRRSGPQ